MGQDRERFAQALEKITALAAAQKNVVSKGQVESLLAETGVSLDQGQTALVYDYLKSKKIGVGRPVDFRDYLTQKEVTWLQGYEEGLRSIEAAGEGELQAVAASFLAQEPDARRRLVELFLLQIPQLAQIYAGQGVFLEDLVGEANVALLTQTQALAPGEFDSPEKLLGRLTGSIMESMEGLIDGDAREKRFGKRVAKNANLLQKKAAELYEELGREALARELARETGLSEEEVRETVRLAGNRFKYLDADDFPDVK